MPRGETAVVALVLLGGQLSHHRALVIGAADRQILGHGAVGLHGADAVDAGDRGDDHHIVALQQRPGGGVAHPVDLFVNLRLFFNISVGSRHIGLGLIVVVVRDEILNRVVGKESPELAIKLRRQRLVRGQDDGGALSLLDDLGHGEGLAGAGCAQQNLILLALLDPRGELGDRGGLVAGGFEFGLHDQPNAALQLVAFERLAVRALGER